MRGSFMEDICGDVESPPHPARAWADLLTLRRAIAAERPRGLAGFHDPVKGGILPQRCPFGTIA